MDELDDAALAAALAEAGAYVANQNFQSVASVGSALNRKAGGEDDPVRALVVGLEYHLVMDAQRRGPYGAFGPMIEMEGRSYPPPIDQIDNAVPGVYAVWERAARLTQIPLVRARFSDLLWESRFGDRPYEFAQSAIDAYTGAALGDFGHPVERMHGLQRAIEIASEINDQQRRAHAVNAAAGLVKDAIAATENMPGVALPLLELFVEDRPERRPADLDQMLEDAVVRFTDDAWTLETVLDLQARLQPPAKRAALRARQVDAFRDLAGRTSGLVRYAHLQHAIELAETYGLHPLADDIRRDVEQMSPEDLNLKVVSAEVSIPREDVDAFIDWFVGDDDIAAALTRFGAHVPTGDPVENQRYVEQLKSDFPLQFLFTRMAIGPENSLVRSTQGDDAQSDQALTDHESERASMFSLFAVDILRRIAERYGPIAAAATWFESDLIEGPVAVRIGRAIELWEANDPDSSASVLAPRLERIVRRIAAAVGLTVTRSPDARGRSGGVKGLNEILAALDGFLHEPTRRYLRVLLAEVTALNLRNRVGHGLDDGITEREAALLIHAACHLRLLTPAASS